MSLWRAVVLAATLAVAPALTGCAGSTGNAAPRPSFSPSPTPLPCPPGPAGLKAWPTGIPTDLPLPPSAKVSVPLRVTNGVRVLRLETSSSLRDSVLFIVRELPKAGYALGRGDAEPTEADAPFVKGTLRGAIRLAAIAPCRTFWLVAVVDVAASPTSPLLPPHSTSASPSPLPFG